MKGESMHHVYLEVFMSSFSSSPYDFVTRFDILAFERYASWQDGRRS
jgi:hypothetical protein